MMAVESHDHAVSKLYVVSGVHSAGCAGSVAGVVASDLAALETAHRDHGSHSSHATLFHLAHVAATRHDASFMHPLSRQHLSTHLGMVTWLKFAILVCPSRGHASFDVV